jgi:hypothetical protein
MSSFFIANIASTEPSSVLAERVRRHAIQRGGHAGMPGVDPALVRGMGLLPAECSAGTNERQRAPGG